MVSASEQTQQPEPEQGNEMVELFDEASAVAYKLGRCVGRDEGSWESFAWGVVLGALATFVGCLMWGGVL